MKLSTMVAQAAGFETEEWNAGRLEDGTLGIFPGRMGASYKDAVSGSFLDGLTVTANGMTGTLKLAKPGNSSAAAILSGPHGEQPVTWSDLYYFATLLDVVE